MWKILLIALLVTSNTFAQSGSRDEQFNKQIEEIMNARAEMLKALMNDSMSGDFEKRMQEVMKNFTNQGDFGFGQMEGPIVGEYDWIETNNHKILKIKVKQIKDKPLDIKIQNNEIKIKGEVESAEVRGKSKITNKVNFERTFEIPEDVDKTSPEFENGKDGFMEIKFKKMASRSNSKKKVTSDHDTRVPVVPDSKDLSI